MRSITKRSKIKEGNRFVTIFIYLLVIAICIITIYPMYYVLILSVSAPEAAARMDVYWYPKGFFLDAYKMLVGDWEMWRAYLNTILYTVPTTFLMLVTSVLVAYPLTYKRLMGRKYVNMFLLIPMYFSGGMIPAFLLITKLGLYGNPLSQIIPASFSIWNIILMKAFFSSIPEGLREAAKIDGAGVLRILKDIYLPLSKPILAVIAVYTIVGTWNSWFNALIYLPRTDWQPLQLFLRRILVESTRQVSEVLSPEMAAEMVKRQMSGAQLKYAMIIFTTLPILFTYPFFQKYFVKGVMLGSLKE
ncbi:carbohydrate ABC transporter permease [Anaerocolumna sp. MB42-C2]|uniref:carbohydrate ABC transporter permease n=1 Tax=Anaerocolumna sp. MB42-C2 TaxID=3070997 RepID=UPI0027DF6A63|nr:carbohydrate ABC transporter permease [Anaerocolumna sp. MB42-C2]WMJ88989.1 carbohydrate ABC transporter permease [Anaerocolumna sp. MB42-C2]